jgi:hypothetical protein
LISIEPLSGATNDHHAVPWNELIPDGAGSPGSTVEAIMFTISEEPSDPRT